MTPQFYVPASLMMFELFMEEILIHQGGGMSVYTILISDYPKQLVTYFLSLKGRMQFTVENDYPQGAC